MRNLRWAALAALAVAAGPALAQEMAWVTLGERTVADGLDRDTFNVRNSGGFRQLQICVDRAPVRFLEVNVRFQDSTSHTIRLRNRIGAGRCSRNLDLGGRDRVIAAVEMVYETAASGGERGSVMLLAR